MQLSYLEDVFPQTSLSHPSSPSFEGNFNFNVSLKAPDAVGRSTSWIFSPVTQKLYVNKNAPCPFTFSTNSAVPSNTYIRAAMFYTQPQFFNNAVNRCITHLMEEQDTGGSEEAEHLVRCEVGVYQTDYLSKRHSVLVTFHPYYEPQKSEFTSIVNLKFACLSSCPGGPNRRPLVLMFTLERGTEILGRKRINLKICACPIRDKLNEEERCNFQNKTSVSNKKDSFAQMSTDLACLPLPPIKKKKKETSVCYTIKMKNYECYQFLKQVQQTYEMYFLARRLFRNVADQQFQNVDSTTTESD